MLKKLLSTALAGMLACPYGVLAQSTTDREQQGAPMVALGYPVNSHLLIIEAEDFGMALSVDKATMEAFSLAKENS